MWGLEEIREYLKNNLKRLRYGHTLGVVNTAIKLAEVYGEDKNKAEITAFAMMLQKIWAIKVKKNNRRWEYCFINWWRKYTRIMALYNCTYNS